MKVYRAKTPRAQNKTRCHFDQREKSFLDPSHSLGMTVFCPSPLRLCAFAREYSSPESDFFPAKAPRRKVWGELFRISISDLTLASLRLSGRRFLSDRQRERELTAFADFTFHPDPSSVQFDELLGQR